MEGRPNKTGVALPPTMEKATTPDVDRTRALYATLNRAIRSLREEVIAMEETGRPPSSEARLAEIRRLDDLLGREGRSDYLPPLLIVEDDPVSVQLLQVHLGLLGLVNPQVVATTGEAAIAQLTRCLQAEDLPALVLLDGHLPGRDGLSVLTWIREQELLADLPVVMLTGESRVDWISEAYGLGIASYLVKPVGIDALTGVIRSLPLRWGLLGP